MKNLLIKTFAVIILLWVSACASIRSKNEKFKVDTDYVPNQLIVVYKGGATEDQRLEAKAKILNRFPSSQIKKCNSCDDNIELFEGENIHTYIHRMIRSGARSTNAVGEDEAAYYFLNFISHLPVDSISKKRVKYQDKLAPVSEKKNKVTIAVLDTGVDRNLIPTANLWKNANLNECYPEAENGWNFLTNTPEIHDDNPSLHGTIINGYIINQFRNSPNNSVKLMNLKTHDTSGSGNLFSIICAIHFAKNNGANIINASWGFYEYDHRGKTIPYLDSLVTTVLRKEGVLFLTASGNRTDDSKAIELGMVPPRDLNIHHFYPAYFGNTGESEFNNMITVTTIDRVEGVSPTQNYSINHVDLGVQADVITSDGFYQFETPFSEDEFTGGSSYATAIAAGKIGAYLPISFYTSLPQMKKVSIMDKLDALADFGSRPIIHLNDEVLGEHIRKGRYIIK